MTTPAGPQVGTAWIAITPSFAGFASSMSSDLTSELTGTLTQAGDQAGDDAGGQAGDSFRSSFGDRMQGLSDTMAGPGAAAGGVLAGALAMGMDSAMDLSAVRGQIGQELDLSEAAAEQAGQVAGDVYADGWGSSVEEVGSAITAVGSSVEDVTELSSDELEGLSESALALARRFDIDVAEAATAAGTLIRNDLAADGTEAFDLITRAAQELPASMRADIPAVVQEYSEHFQRLGLDGAQAFGMMSQFVQAGGRDIDQAADVIHEFQRITSEETEKAAEAFDALGLDADDMLSRLESGGPEASAALSETLGALRELGPGAERSALAVELFGDMAGESTDALFAMDPATATAKGGMEDVAGASEELTSAIEDSPAQQMTSAMRTLAGSLGEALLPAITKVSEFAGEHPRLFQLIAVGVLGAAAAVAVLTVAIWAINAALLANPITWIILAVVAGIAALAAVVTLVIVYWDEIVAATRVAWQWIQDVVGIAIDWLKTLFLNWTGPGLIIKYWDDIVAAARAAWEWIKDAAGAALTWLKDLFLNWTGPGRIIKHWDDIKNAVGSAIDWVKTTVGDGIQWVEDRIDDLSAIPGKVVGFFSGLGSDIASPIWRGFRDGINDIIAGWNGLSFSIPGVDWPGPGSWGGMTIGTPNIPYLARGGIAMGPTLAMVGEGGRPEVIAPLDRLEQMMQDMVPPVRARVASGRSAEPAPVVEIVAGDRHLMAWLESTIRTRYGGDITRVGRAQ